MNLIFFGSSHFSLEGLKAAMNDPDIDIALVITTPPSKKGRGLHKTPTIIAEFSRENNLPVAEFPSLKDDDVYEAVRILQPEIFVSSSYGFFIPKRFLALPKWRFNIHPSLLPQHRGASPLNAPILNGDEMTGLSIADITPTMDAGDLYFQETYPLGDKTTATELDAELSELSFGALSEVFKQMKAGTLRGIPQNHDLHTYAEKLQKEDGHLNFEMTAQTMDRKIRGLLPWPGTFFFAKEERVVITEARATSVPDAGEPGEILATESSDVLLVCTKQGALEISKVKPAGKKEMSGAEFARGRRLKPGECLD